MTTRPRKSKPTKAEKRLAARQHAFAETIRAVSNTKWVRGWKKPGSLNSRYQ